jgi:ribose 5-phosphate isomerase B
MKIVLAADHGGFAAKQTLKSWLTATTAHQFWDAGAASLQPDDDFPLIVRQAVTVFRQQHADRLILWCRSGVGVDIAANRYPDFYCGLAINVDQIIAATRDDHLNALALASDYTAIPDQKLLINAFLATSRAEEPRFARRVRQLADLGVD